MRRDTKIGIAITIAVVVAALALIYYYMPAAFAYQYSKNETVLSYDYTFHLADLYNVTLKHSITPDPPIAGEKAVMHLEFWRYLPLMPITKTYHPSNGTMILLKPKLQNESVTDVDYTIKDFVITNFTSTNTTALINSTSKILGLGHSYNGMANVTVTFEKPGKHFVMVKITGIDGIPTSIMKHFEHPTFEITVSPPQQKVPEFGLQSAIILAVSIGVIILVTQRTNLRLK